MATVNEIKNELEFNRELITLLEVMKNIAVFEFRALQRKRTVFTNFNQILKGFFPLIDTLEFNHPFIKPVIDKPALVMVTSDEGFMGGLNLQVINKALKLVGNDEVKLIVVGQRGAQHLKESGRDFSFFSAKKEGLPLSKEAELLERYKLAWKITACLLEGIKQKEFGRIVVSYPKPLSFMVQKVEIIQLLPFFEADQDSFESELIVESPLEEIVQYLTGQFIVNRLAEIFQESKLSEFAARAIHLEKSNQGMAEKEKQLKFQYFRAHHELIDKNIRELFSSQLIRKRQ